MKVLILIFCLFSFGCAHKMNLRSLDESPLDGLRFESLNRYNSNRLETISKEHKTIAMCHKGDYNKAQEEFKLSLDKNKNQPRYWNHLATCYLLNNNLSQAKFYFDLALKTAKKDKTMQSIIYNNLGIYYSKLAQDQLALTAFETSIKFSKKHLTSKYNLAQVYLKYGLYKKAEVILEDLIKVAPNDVDFINSIGHLNLMSGNYKKAKYYYEKIPQKYMKRDDFATNYSMTLYMLQSYKEALKILKEAEMEQAYYRVAQTELIKNIERQLQ